MKSTPAHYRPFAGGYVSDFGKFLNEFMAQHPDLQKEQQRGWYIWWDHPVDLDELDKQRADSVPVKPYHYE